MPKIIEQPENLGGLPRLNDEKQAPTILRAGRHKWQKLRDKIPYIKIGRSRFWTDEALLDFLRQSTVQPATQDNSKPRRAAPRKVVPPPSKGRRRDNVEREAQP